MEEEIDEEIRIRDKEKKIIKSLFQKKFFIFLVIVILIGLLCLAWYTRTVNVPNLKDITTGNYTLGPDLDPFLFTRYAKIIVQEGQLPEVDKMRYFPLGWNPAKETRLLPYMIAYFHNFLSLFKDVSVNYSAVMFPAFMFLLTVLAFFLFVKKIFENKGKTGTIIALLSTAFLIVSPALIARTIAGIPEKESAGFLFMFLSLYFFISSWKSFKLKKTLIFAFLAGISTALMGLIWGGWIYIFTTISVFAFLCFLFGKTNKKTFFLYSLWLGTSYIVSYAFSGRINLSHLLTSTSTVMCNIIFLLFLVDFLIFNTRLKEIKFIKKFPRKLVSLSVIFLIGLISLLFGMSLLQNLFKDISIKLTQPYVDRLSLTVAENKQPYFNNWRSSFVPIVRGISVFFWLFFIGSIFLFYETMKKIDLKKRIIIVTLYILFLFALIFSRYSPNSIFNGQNFISNFFYFGSLALFGSSLGYILYKSWKEETLDKLKKINSSYLFLIAFFLISLIGARSAIRLIMVLHILAAILISYFFIFIIEISRKQKKLFFISIVIVILSVSFIFYSNYRTTIGTAKSFVPSSYTQQWQKAMGWVRENTPEKAVFGKWWDYGYWIQSIGNRATMLDGGNSISYWNYLMGRHVLTGESEEEALELLYAHNVTYYLIDSTDIGKYSAYSNIGSDENYDRFSWIGTFHLNEKLIQEKRNETTYPYEGSIALDEDYLYKEGNTQIFFPRGAAGVGFLVFVIDNKNNPKQPSAVFVYNGQQVDIPLRYLYYQGKLHDFQEGYEGCVYILPKIEGNNINNLGSAFFLSERNMRALWVRIYLLEEGERFELVHNEPSFLIENLRGQGLEIGDFVYFQGIQGPIKIWKINYKGDEKINPEYLEVDYPERIKQRKYP